MLYVPCYLAVETDDPLVARAVAQSIADGSPQEPQDVLHQDAPTTLPPDGASIHYSIRATMENPRGERPHIWYPVTRVVDEHHPYDETTKFAIPGLLVLG